MDTTRFDRLTISLGTKLSRRKALAMSAAGVAAAGFARTAPAIAQDATPEGQVTEHPAFLFVQLADSGTWMPKPGEEGVYLLTLSGTGEQTLYFSDRPDRIVGTLPTDQFLDALGFTPVEPPNAAVVVTTPDGTRDVLVVELFDPVYTEDVTDRGADTLVYKARVLDAYHDGNLQSWYEEEDDPTLPETFADVSLLIDDCADLAWCYRQGATIFDPKTPIGPLPNGPVGMCFTWSFQGCLPCNKTSIYHWWEICNQTYPDCQGNCEAL